MARYKGSSAYTADTVVSVKRTNKKGESVEVSCPDAISFYNKYMGGAWIFLINFHLSIILIESPQNGGREFFNDLRI